MYTGPYLVIRIIEPVNYVLQKSVKSKPFVVHADKLKKCFGATPNSWLITSADDKQQEVDERSLDVAESLPEKKKPATNNNKQSKSKYNEPHIVNEIEDRPRRVDRRIPKRFNEYVM